MPKKTPQNHYPELFMMSIEHFFAQSRSRRSACSPREKQGGSRVMATFIGFMRVLATADENTHKKWDAEVYRKH